MKNKGVANADLAAKVFRYYKDMEKTIDDINHFHLSNPLQHIP